MMASLALDDYTVAWICALPLEAAAARAMLDRTHPLPQGIMDLNVYELGELNGHYIVLACLPCGVYGATSDAVVVSRMRRTFPRLQFGLMVGIGGGVPSRKNDIRLGDVVVSKPGVKHGGVIQYDYGKTVQGGNFEQTGVLNQPPQALLTRLSQLQANRMTSRNSSLSEIISKVLERYPEMREQFSPPEEHTDILFDSTYYHIDKESDCGNCDKERLVKRQPRDNKEPSIHYGLIASGNQVMKDAETRDRLARKQGILCFEMEAAGIMNELPMLVIRGICDYCDSHKQKQWQRFAALTAAAYANLLLSITPTYQGDSNSRKSDITRHWIEDSNSIPGWNRQREGTFIAPLTDSGYASTTHQKVLREEEYRRDNVHDVQSIVSGEEEFSSPPAAASPRNAEDDHSDDAESIYTAGPGISPSDQQSYISELANDLFRKVQYDQDDQHLPERIHGILPRLLKAFAMRFGQLGSTQIHRDIMVFIRRHRDEIANSLRIKYLEDQLDSQDSAHDDTKMGLGDLMDLWHQNLEDADDDIGIPKIDNGAESSSIDEDIPIEDDDEDLPGLTAYRMLITDSPVYEWLLGSFRRGLHLHPAEPNAQDAICHRILDSLPSPLRVSRYDQPRIYQVVFHLNWDPMAFITEQEYDICKEGFLGKIITITGTSQDAQAMTCLQYLHQTWHSCGSNILQLIEATLFDERDYEHRCTLPDNTQLAAWVSEKEFLVEVTGIEDSIAEIGEQLAWLGSALRSSPHDSRISYCTPFVRNASVEDTSISTPQMPSITRISCGIDFKLDDQEQVSPPSPMGQCWHHLFRNPTVVMGFPIPYRSRQGTGLEIPLNILAGLVQANQVDVFSDKLVIKGFSSLLIPTEYIRDQDQMMWHLRYNMHGDRISYLDGIGAHVGHITLADLESSRHILGWCSDARCYAGAADANYSINRSWLRPPSSRCSLSNTFIAAGRLVTGGDPAIYGNKDIPYRLTRDDYIEKLSWIARQYVVMWDAGEKRGWLVNGACALLHLLLASFYFNRTDPLGFVFRLDPTDFKVREKTFTPNSAIEVLLNPDILSLELYHAKQGEPSETTLPPARIRDRVDRLYSILEKIMDHQAEIMGPNGRASRNMARGNLEGWDFKDLATQEDPLYPRFCKLGTRGKSWVDFTRDICAATLFGTGFGEILRPVATSQPCPYWSTLPGGKSYLAVSGYDLSNIIDRCGNPRANPVRLTRNVIWCNSLGNGPPACKCIGYPEQTEHSELAQVILPLHFRKRIPNHNAVRLSGWGHGAVVFGYNRDLRWSWNDTGFPEQEDVLLYPDDSGSDSDDEFHDSGLGPSLVPSATVDDDDSSRLPLSSSPPAGITHEDYEVGIVCALWKELLAIRALFDATHPELEKDRNDPNCYCLGRIKGFNVVAAGLPDDDYGTNSATNVASHLIRTFPQVKFCLVVGIGGGVPSAAHDIRLGDVVVGTSVIQVDMGKWIQNSEFRMTAEKQQPAPLLRAVITKIRSNGMISFDSALNPLLDDLNLIASMKLEYQYPGADRDILFDSDYVHVEDGSTCDNCMGNQRPRTRQHAGPNVFYGLIASENQVVRDARHRDRLGRENVICVEMEAAGVMRTTTNCLVIRGICDYADSHKNKQWQEYAAATAAAYAKFFLSHMRESVHDIAVRVPSRLETSTAPVYLQKQKRAAPCADQDQPLVLKRSRRH
ncbi:purine and uridine phosphorylase [Aspergillus aurantiobrunneus]